MRTCWVKLLALPLVLATFGVGQALAQYGPGQSLCDGEVFVVQGEVIKIGGVQGTGLVVDTDGGLKFVYGIAPVWYWSELGLARPQVGDEVMLGASHVRCMDEPVLIWIHVDGTDYLFRDDDCFPYWQGGAAN